LELVPSISAPALISNRRPYYGWAIVVCAAWAMTATLPGRTFGLGLISEPLMASFHLDQVTYGELNLMSVLIGAAFCVPIGALMDRWGARPMLTLVMVGLGAVVIAMSRTESPRVLAAAMTLTRGLGESSLSVLSMALVGKWFSRRLSTAMAVFSVLIAFGFCAAIPVMGKLIEHLGWRDGWQSLGIAVLGSGVVVGLLLVRNGPQDSAIARREFSLDPTDNESHDRDFSFRAALTAPAFWCFAVGASMYNMAFSAVSLYAEAVLNEQGFDPLARLKLLSIVVGSGVLCNLLGGWLGTKVSLGKLLGATLLLLAGSLASFPAVHSQAALVAFAIGVGGTGGVVTVVFFSVWAQQFGRSHLGRIQGAAQICSVLASATGPLLLAHCHEHYGNYVPFFYAIGGAAAISGIACLLVPLPSDTTVAEPELSVE
jgi:MFS family permease